MYKTNVHYKSDQPFKYSIGGGSKVADSAPSAARRQLCVGGGVVKVSSIGIGRKGVRFKRAFIMLLHAKKKMSHSIVSPIMFAGRLRECIVC